MEQRVTLITLGVEDLDNMRSFYRDVFGWKPLENSSEEVVFFQLNGIQLGLYGRVDLADDAGVDSGGSGFKGFALAHNMRTEKEVDQLFEELESKGAEIVKSPQKTFWGGYSGYVSDPEGNLWEIAYNPYMEYDKSGNVIV